MYSNNSPNLDTREKKMIGEILQEAGLISSAQLEIALADQSNFVKLKIGEILVLRGWLKQQTVDFLVESFLERELTNSQKNYPIGQYFKQAGLLSEIQINTIIQQQKQLGIKFCQLAVMKGFLNQQTADFFLKNLSNKLTVNKERTLTPDDYDTINDSKIQTIVSNYTLYELVKDQEKIIKTDKLEENLSLIITSNHDSEIEYSSIWIDV
jgi:hypothetical protein